jgi:hypothetical protein
MTEPIVLLFLCSCKEVTKKARRTRNARVHYSLRTRPPHIRRRVRFPYAQKLITPCENLVPSVEAVNDSVGDVGQQAGLIPLLRIPLGRRNPESGTESSAEGVARDVKNFRGASFSFGSFSFGRAKENEHKALIQLATGFFSGHFCLESIFETAVISRQVSDADPNAWSK